MMTKTILSTTVAAAALLAATTAFSADYESGVVTKTPSDVYTPVEFGSGWYIRGDISYNLGGRHETSSQFVPALGGSVDAEYDDVIGYKIGAGYVFNPSFRIDATIEQSLDSEFNDLNFVTLSGTREDADPITGAPVFTPVADIPGTEAIEASYNSTNLMLNGYFDLPTMGAFTPYIGAGIGLARVEYNERRTMSCTPYAANVACGNPVAGGAGVAVTDAVVVDYEDTSYTHAYQLSVGTAYALSETLALDVGYSYFTTGDGPELNYADGTAIDVDGYSVHKLNMGLRYELW